MHDNFRTQDWDTRLLCILAWRGKLPVICGIGDDGLFDCYKIDVTCYYCLLNNEFRKVTKYNINRIFITWEAFSPEHIVGPEAKRTLKRYKSMYLLHVNTTRIWFSMVHPIKSKTGPPSLEVSICDRALWTTCTIFRPFYDNNRKNIAIYAKKNRI